MARSFASFCSRFSDACSATNTLTLTDATATTLTDAAATDGTSTNPSGSANQASRTASTGSAGSNRHVGSTAGFVVVAAMLVAV